MFAARLTLVFRRLGISRTGGHRVALLQLNNALGEGAAGRRRSLPCCLCDGRSSRRIRHNSGARWVHRARIIRPSHHGPAAGYTARRLRDSRPDWRRGHGRGLQGARHAARPRRRAQGSRPIASPATPSAVRGSTAKRAIIAALAHPTICTLHDVGVEDDSAYFVMEFLDGDTLAERLIKGPMPLETALGVAIEIGEALDRCAPRRHRPSRPEAGQRDADEDGREAARLRTGPAGRSRRLAGGRDENGHHAGRRVATDRGTLLGTLPVHGARASCRARRPTRVPTSGRSAPSCTRC